MNSLLVLCLLAASCVVAFGQNNDDQCKNDFKTFMECAKSSTSASDRDAKKKDLQAKADKCFTDAGCDTANWDEDPMGGKGHGGMGGGMGGMPDDVKQCIKKKMMKTIGDKLNECLQKHNVRSVDFSSMADGDGAGAGLDGGHEGMQGAMSAQFQAVKAVDKCAQKKGGDTKSVKPLEQCLQDVKKSAKPQVCAALKPCEDKVSQPCLARGKEIMKTLCQCKKEKEAEIAAKLRPLGAQAKVSIQDLLKTVSEDFDVNAMMDDVDACYKETNEKEPAIMALAKAFLKNGGGPKGRSSPSMSVNGSTVTIMADMLDLDAQDKSECDDCPK